MRPNVHPTAIVHEGARVHESVKIGPYCVIGDHVTIGAECQLHSHVVIQGRTTLGARNRIFPFASIGSEPQDLKYQGEPSELVIGDDNVFRENVTVNPGTKGGGMVTRIGSGCLFMAYSHVAHDCRIGDRVILANCATLAGHVTVEEDAIIGGLSAVHQFVRIGKLAMVGGKSGVVKDIPPFCLAAGGYRPHLAGLNIVGLKRKGIPTSSIQTLKALYRILLMRASKMSLSQRLERAQSMAKGDEYALHLIEFVRTAQRGITLHRGGDGEES